MREVRVGTMEKSVGLGVSDRFRFVISEFLGGSIEGKIFMFNVLISKIILEVWNKRGLRFKIRLNVDMRLE